MIRTSLAVTVAALLFTNCLPALAAPARPNEAISDIDWLRAARLDLHRQGNGLSGPGWDRLMRDGRDSTFLMIGEQHASATIADIETAIFLGLALEGYDHATLEVGPYSASFAERRIRQGQGKLADYLRTATHGFSIPFLFLTGETRMAEEIVARSRDKGPVLWGVDQEFIGGAPIIADLLEPMARNDAQRRAVVAWRSAALADPFLLGKGDDAPLRAVEAAFAGNQEAQAMVAEIRSSRAIYRPFVGGGGTGYEANLARENGMKRKFQHHFEAAEKWLGRPPRVFFKFGGYHAMRGISGTDVPSFTNFLAEWGASRGLNLTNIMVDCLGGTSLNPQTSKPEPCESYIGKEGAILDASAGGPELQLYDLRSLRPALQRHQDLDPTTRRTILAFDYYLIVRDGQAATPIGDLSGK